MDGSRSLYLFLCLDEHMQSVNSSGVRPSLIGEQVGTEAYHGSQDDLP